MFRAKAMEYSNTEAPLRNFMMKFPKKLNVTFCGFRLNRCIASRTLHLVITSLTHSLLIQPMCQWEPGEQE